MTPVRDIAPRRARPAVAGGGGPAARRGRGFRAALAALGLLLGAPAAAERALPRVASTTLCADQYLLALAAPGQIASLSWMATGPNSAYREAAARLPSNRGSVEELVASGAEIVLLGAGADPQTRRVLDAFGIEPVFLPFAEDFAAVAEALHLVGAAIGRPEAAAAAAAEMRARLAALRPAPGAPRPRALYYRPGGGGAGAGTSVHAVIEAAGMRNHQAELGGVGWSGLPLEAMIVDPPDGLIVSFFDSAPASARAPLARNPVFRRAVREMPVAEVPGRLWVCGHPKMVEAAERLAAARPRFLAAMRRARASASAAEGEAAPAEVPR